MGRWRYVWVDYERHAWKSLQRCVVDCPLCTRCLKHGAFVGYTHLFSHVARSIMILSPSEGLDVRTAFLAAVCLDSASPTHQ